MKDVSVLRPGLLVSLKTSVRGNVNYKKLVIEEDHLTEYGELKNVVQTERTISDPTEHETAIKTRSRCRTLVTAVCTKSNFGLLCREADVDKLDAAVAEARKIAEEFNAQATLTRIGVFIIAGRVAPDDVEAVRAIRSEVRDLVADMERGVQALDVEAIRTAANKARDIGSMLSPEAAERVKEAVSVARKAARAMVKAAETGAAEVDHAVLAKLASARTAFLDLGQDGETIEVEAPEATARALDLSPEAEAFRQEVAEMEGVDPSTLTPVRALGIADVLERGNAKHSVLCKCPECEALVGTAADAVTPSIAARQIDLD